MKLRLGRSTLSAILWLIACVFNIPNYVIADPGDPLRVKCGNAVGSIYKTVLTSNGQPLRAAKVTVTKEYLDTTDDLFYKAVKDAGLNAVRIVCFDAYYRRHPNVDPGYPTPSTTYILDPSISNDIDRLLSDLTAVVNKCRDNGLYAIINCHDIGFAYDSTYFNQFWNVVAPAFRTRTHVLYELVNEVDWKEENPDAAVISLVPFGLTHPGTLTSTNPDAPWKIVDKLLPLHTLVRRLAPDTHISLFSFALSDRSFAGWWNMKGMASDIHNKSQLTQFPIDWSKTSINFHNYAYGGNPSESSIIETALAYPVMCGEVGFTSSVAGLLAPGSNSYGGRFNPTEQCATTSLERLKIAWGQWDLDWTPNGARFKMNYKIVLNNALFHGLYWSDTRLPPYVYVITTRFGAGAPGTGKAISIRNSVNSDGGLLVLNPRNTSNTFQKFSLTDRDPSPANFYEIRCIGSNKSWDVPGGEGTPSLQLQQWRYDALLNPWHKHFGLQKVQGTAYFRIHMRHFPALNNVVDLAGPSDNDLTKIQQYPMSPNGTYNQHWHFFCTDIP